MFNLFVTINTRAKTAEALTFVGNLIKRVSNPAHTDVDKLKYKERVMQ